MFLPSEDQKKIAVVDEIVVPKPLNTHHSCEEEEEEIENDIENYDYLSAFL